MSILLSSVLAILAVATHLASAHMTIWTPAMYGVGWKARNPLVNDWDYLSGDPFAPLGPDWPLQSDWWFRGPLARSLPPKPGAVELLPAGGRIMLEISCHVAWTQYGWATTPPGSYLDACPGNTGAYHSGDPMSPQIDLNLLSGCALGIADVDDINKVTMDNLVIFSVQKDCVKQKQTYFDIPAKMPPCTGSKCICGWFWLANNGTGNYYMTAFDCKVTNSPADARPIAPPVDPTWCDRDDLKAGRCKTTPGAKRPIYFYNSPSNMDWHGNNDRPGYHDNYSFKHGAQNDIFLPAAPASTTTTTTTTATTTTTTTTSTSTTTTTTAASTTSSATTTTTAANPGSTDVACALTQDCTNAGTTVPAFANRWCDTSRGLCSWRCQTGRTLVGGQCVVVQNTPAPTTITTTTTQAEPTTTTTTTTTTTAAATTTSSAPPAPSNLALVASVVGSTSQNGSPGRKVADGIIDGLRDDGSGDVTAEWVTRGQKSGAWVKLSWYQPITLTQIILHDRPNSQDQVSGATVFFSDGTQVNTGILWQNGQSTYVNLPEPKTITSLLFKVTHVSRTTQNIGLSELEVYNKPVDSFNGKYIKTVIRTPRVKRSLLDRPHPRDFSLSKRSQAEIDEEQMMLDAGIDYSEIVRRSSGMELTAEHMF
ncbi:hypothetical protein OIV83_000077 [Microbotryomycetes sp. JL201]|nr:hypothetical protein OIV83_000077 [Microbotryomycetes sp. JL201]